MWNFFFNNFKDKLNDGSHLQKRDCTRFEIEKFF